MENQGQGKSTSLRNFTKENEVAVINVLNKPLPFRSNIKSSCRRRL